MKRNDLVVYIGNDILGKTLKHQFNLIQGMKYRFHSLTNSKKYCHILPLEDKVYVRSIRCKAKDVLNFIEYRKFKIQNLL